MFPCIGYLKLAKKLAVINDEASMRSAVSRAYYAAFHKAKLFAENDGIGAKFSSDAKAHREVVEFLKKHADLGKRLLSPKLNRLRINRNTCDYKNSVKEVKKIAR